MMDDCLNEPAYQEFVEKHGARRFKLLPLSTDARLLLRTQPAQVGGLIAVCGELCKKLASDEFTVSQLSEFFDRDGNGREHLATKMGIAKVFMYYRTTIKTILREITQ